MQTYDAVVIGGGIAGLVSAIELAKADKRVILLEKAGKAGGRGGSVVTKGAVFNLGGHALFKEGEAFAAFQEYGLRLTGGSPKTDGKAIWREGIAPLPGTALGLLASPLLGWRGKVQLGRLLMGLQAVRTQELGRVTLREWAEKTIHDPMARHIVYALLRTSTYCKEIDFQLAGPAIAQVQRALRGGVMYVDGGWQSIVKQLQEKAERLGVTVSIGMKAAEILRQNGAAAGVRLADGQTLSAAGVIAAVPPAELTKLLPGAEIAALQRWRDEARPITSACLDIGLKRLPVPDRHSAIGLDQPVFFTNHSRVSKLSDNGTIVVHLIKYNDLGGGHPKEDERLLERTMELLHPGWRDAEVVRQYLPSITVAYDYAHTGRSGPPVGPDVPGVRGLCVAGDWAGHDELLADAAAASAKRAAAALLRQDQAAQMKGRDMYHVV